MTIAAPHVDVPALSVVLAAVNGWDVLGPTLDALDAQPERDRMEVIVVDPLRGAVTHPLQARRMPVELVEVDQRLSIPRLRYLGVRKARAPIIAILEDHCAVGPGWAHAVLESHRGNWGAVGGPVENGQRGLVNWAAFLSEYARYMGPLREGACADLPGNNIAYKRPHLWKHAQLLDQGRWESWINDRLRADGVALGVANGMAVRHIKPFRLLTFLGQRFHFSRSFAGMRRQEQTPLRRLVYAAGSVILPPLLLLRIARQVIGKGRHYGVFLATSPILLLILTVGAAGEMVGYLFGPGTSLERVE